LALLSRRDIRIRNRGAAIARRYETFADVTPRLPHFIEDVYNAKRVRSSLGYLSSDRFGQLYARRADWFAAEFKSSEWFRKFGRFAHSAGESLRHEAQCPMPVGRFSSGVLRHG
jgi:hypothetical protein